MIYQVSITRRWWWRRRGLKLRSISFVAHTHTFARSPCWFSNFTRDRDKESCSTAFAENITLTCTSPSPMNTNNSKKNEMRQENFAQETKSEIIVRFSLSLTIEINFRAHFIHTSETVFHSPHFLLRAQKPFLNFKRWLTLAIDRQPPKFRSSVLIEFLLLLTKHNDTHWTRILRAYVCVIGHFHLPFVNFFCKLCIN